MPCSAEAHEGDGLREVARKLNAPWRERPLRHRSGGAARAAQACKRWLGGRYANRGNVRADVEPETTAIPRRVSIALTGAAPDHQGVLHVTPNCMSLDELEGCINALQDELDVIRGEARRIFVASVGHA